MSPPVLTDVTAPVAEARIVPAGGDALWFLGTLARIKLTGEDTAGRFSLWEAVLPRGAAPPLHSHPQDETLYVIDGEITAWIVEPELAARSDEDPPAWLATRARRLGAGAVVFAPGGIPHTFRVESDSSRMLALSTPAGIEDMVRGLAEPAKWPWLPPPADGPRVAADRQAAIELATGMVRHGPPPPPATSARA